MVFCSIRFGISVLIQESKIYDYYITSWFLERKIISCNFSIIITKLLGFVRKVSCLDAKTALTFDIYYSIMLFLILNEVKR